MYSYTLNILHDFIFDSPVLALQTFIYAEKFAGKRRDLLEIIKSFFPRLVETKKNFVCHKKEEFLVRLGVKYFLGNRRFSMKLGFCHGHCYLILNSVGRFIGLKQEQKKQEQL